MKIAVLKGDGIGPEIVEAAQLVLNKVDEKYNLRSVMKLLLKLEMGGFILMLPGEKVARKTK